jgi:hypothetical protein
MLSIRPNPLLSHAVAALSVALATLTALGIEQVASVPNLSLLFVFPVVVCAIRYGAAAALTAAVEEAGFSVAEATAAQLAVPPPRGSSSSGTYEDPLQEEEQASSS